jgi:Uma2 family endonuclease
MLAISQEPSRMSIKEYLEWEPQQDIRHEYINGEVFAMTGGTLAHNDITLNLYRTLYPQVRSPMHLTMRCQGDHPSPD